MSADMMVAGDHQKNLEDRIDAASRLDISSRNNLRDSLMAQLRDVKHWDTRSRDTIVILGIVGNHETAVYLKRLLDEPTLDIPGKINVAIENSIEAIEAHEHGE